MASPVREVKMVPRGGVRSHRTITISHGMCGAGSPAPTERYFTSVNALSSGAAARLWGGNPFAGRELPRSRRMDSASAIPWVVTHVI
jgi:hypothetical protein